MRQSHWTLAFQPARATGLPDLHAMPAKTSRHAASAIRFIRWPSLNWQAKTPGLPNGLELQSPHVLCGGSCPAKAGNSSPTVRHAGWPDKSHLRPSPPGHFQRVVGSPTLPPTSSRGL